jgi:uncharacterized repeat protein (TIGR01451 family)
VPDVQLENVPQCVLIGEEFTFTVVFKNLSPNDLGFAPFIDLMTQAGGSDWNMPLPPGYSRGPCDGITILSATILSIGQEAAASTGVSCAGDTVLGGPTGNLQPGPMALTVDPSPDYCQATNCLAGSCSALLVHPYAPAVLPVPRINPCDALYSIRMPFPQFDATESPVVVEVKAKVDEFADPDVPLIIVARGGFLFGGTPTGTPLLGTWTSTPYQVTPKVFTLKKEFLGLEHETVAGPNFQVAYEITMDIAENQRIYKLQVTDNLPGTLEYDPLTANLHVDVYGGAAAITSTFPYPCASALPYPPNPFPASVSEPPGGPLDVYLCQSVIGQPNTAGPEVSIAFGCFVPEGVLDTECTNWEPLKNDVQATGDWFPTDPRDPQPTTVKSDVFTTKIETVEAKCMAIRKSVELWVDTGWPGLTPGDTLKYTLTFEISDFHTIGDLVITDHLSDGQKLTVMPGSPVLTVRDQFVPGGYSAVFVNGTTMQELVNPGYDCPPFPQGPPIRGTTDWWFFVSDVMDAATPPRIAAGILTGGHAIPGAPSGTRATGTLIFYAEVTDAFSINDPTPYDWYVDKDDPITNCVEISGTVYRNEEASLVPDFVIGHAGDDSAVCMRIVEGKLEKSVYAVNGWPVSGAPDVLPGDAVTFRIRYNIPSGDAEKLAITDWLPLPVFNVNDCNADMNPIPDPLAWSSMPCPCTPLWWIPATGSAGCGPSHTAPIPTNSCTSFLAPTVSLLLGSNGVLFDYDTMFDCNNDGKKIDLLFTLTVTHEPFADGLYLGNEVKECEDNTFGKRFCQAAIAQVHVRAPKLSIQKGVIATSNPSGVFTINNSPAPLTAGLLIATPPSALCPCFNPFPPITSGSSLAGFIGRDLRNINAGDWVTFAIVVENTGGAKAYEIEVKDTFPLDPTTSKPSCFHPVFPGFSTTWPCVTDGAGVLIPFLFTPGSDHFVIELLLPLEPLNSVTQANGANIAIITFPATSAYKPHVQSDCCPNTATLIRYTSAADVLVLPPGVSVIQPNFVDAVIGGPFEDTALICVGPTAYSKCVQATSEPHTAPPPPSVGSVTGVGTSNVANTVNATIGEIIRFRLVSVIPEGTTQRLQIQDLLPNGLTYVGNPSVAFVTTTGPVTSPAGTWPAIWPMIAGDETTYGSCPGPVIVPPGTAINVATPPFAFGSGQHPTFFVQSPSDSTPIIDVFNPDHDANLELVIIEFNAQVDNILGNQGLLLPTTPTATLLANSFQVTYHDAFTNFTIPSLSDPVFVRIVEPTLTLNKTASLLFSNTAQNIVGYSVTISNNSDVDAFEIILTDTLPAGLTVGGVSCPGGTDYSYGNNVEVHYDRVNAHTSLFPPITYPVKSPALQCDRTITNTATVTWTSLPGTGTPPSSQNLTGQSTVDDPLEQNDGERDGSDGMLGSGVLNDYQAEDSVAIMIPGLDIDTACTYPLPNGICAWWPLDETSGASVQDAAGGFDGTTYPGPIGGFGGPVTSASSSWPSLFFPVGQVDSSLFFYGTRHIEVLHDSNLDPGIGPFTVDAWVIYSPASTNSPECTIVKKGNSGAGWRFVILPASDKLRFEVFGGNWLSAQANVTPDSWHHVAATVARGAITATITLYVDGVAASTSTVSIGSGVSIASTQSLFIGGDGVAAGAIAVDEVEIFHETLQLSDIEAFFFACVSGKCKPDLGDAPDSTNHGTATPTGTPMWAYPGVLAHFPTVYDPTLPGNAPLGPIHWDAKGTWDCVWLGADVSIEGEADTGWDQDMSPLGNNIQPDQQISNRDADDGVANVALQSQYSCGQTSVTFSATNALSTQQAQVYINVWFDWTHDGDWDDTPDTGDCLAGVLPVPERAVQNHIVILTPGLNSGLMTPTFWFLTPLPGQTIWMRIMLTVIPVSASNSDGSGPVGGYEYGETEDYELGPY